MSYIDLDNLKEERKNQGMNVRVDPNTLPRTTRLRDRADIENYDESKDDKKRHLYMTVSDVANRIIKDIRITLNDNILSDISPSNCHGDKCRHDKVPTLDDFCEACHIHSSDKEYWCPTNLCIMIFEEKPNSEYMYGLTEEECDEWNSYPLGEILDHGYIKYCEIIGVRPMTDEEILQKEA